jgi:hypothetical protein
VLWQKSVRAFVIENGVAAAEFHEKLMYTSFEGFGVSGEERGRPFLHKLKPRVVAHTSNINVIFKYVLSDRTENFCSFALVY